MEEYHIRLHLGPDTLPLDITTQDFLYWDTSHENQKEPLRLRFLKYFLANFENIKETYRPKFVISIEGEAENTHLHALADLTPTTAKLLRSTLKNITEHDDHKRAYSIAKRRGNLLSYILKEQDEQNILSLIDTLEPPYYQGHCSQGHLHVQGVTPEKLKHAFYGSYKRIPKEDFATLRRDFIEKWSLQHNCNSSSHTHLEHLQNKFIDDYTAFRIKNNKTPATQAHISFWLLKLRIISPEQFRFRRYTNFF